MNIGDKVVHCPCLATSYGEHKMPPTVGEVVWIHPQKRFYRVRFTMPDGSSWVECFPYNEK